MGYSMNHSPAKTPCGGVHQLYADGGDPYLDQPSSRPRHAMKLVRCDPNEPKIPAAHAAIIEHIKRQVERQHFATALADATAAGGGNFEKLITALELQRCGLEGALDLVEARIKRLRMKPCSSGKG